MAASGGQVTPAAKAAFAAALAIDAKEPRARFYLALAKAQAGHVDQALSQWVALEAESPSNAPWIPMLTSQIEAAAKSSAAIPRPCRGGRRAVSPRRDGRDRRRIARLAARARHGSIRGAMNLPQKLEPRLSLPADWYHRADIYERERHQVFARDWQFLGPASHLPDPGTISPPRSPAGASS